MPRSPIITKNSRAIPTTNKKKKKLKKTRRDLSMDSQQQVPNLVHDTITSHQLDTGPQLCANNCGFYGSASTRNLCSKCYNDFLKEVTKSVAQKLCEDKSTNPTTVSTPSLLSKDTLVASDTASVDGSSAKNRCQTCKKKVGLLGFQCRCGGVYCGEHRLFKEHACTFDYKGFECGNLSKKNPACKGDKLQKM